MGLECHIILRLEEYYVLFSDLILAIVTTYWNTTPLCGTHSFNADFHGMALLDAWKQRCAGICGCGAMGATVWQLGAVDSPGGALVTQGGAPFDGAFVIS